MSSEIDRFWVPVAQLLPVFILALAVEVRLSLRGRVAKWRRRDNTLTKVMAIADIAADLVYSAAFLLAMVFLVASFIIALVVLANGKAATGGINVELMAVIGGVVLTGLLPVVRIWNGKLEKYLLDPFLVLLVIRIRARRVFGPASKRSPA